MLGHDNTSRSKLYKVMTDQQFDEVVSAILDGKYSWACMLILEFAGYNPLYYIPRRTYDRLKKENRRKDIDRNRSSRTKALICEDGRDTVSDFPATESHALQAHRTEIRDLTYLEQADSKSQKVQGQGIEGFDDGQDTASREPNKIKALYLRVSSLFTVELW